MPQRSHRELRVSVTPFGPSEKELRALARVVARHREVRRQLRGTRHRLLGIELMDPPEARKRTAPAEPTRFRAVFFDYTHSRALHATGRLANPSSVRLSHARRHPRPVRSEFDAAVRVVARDPVLGPMIRSRRLTPYPPMPPLVNERVAGGLPQRTIAVGLLPRARERGHEIVGVGLRDRRTHRFGLTARGRAPRLSAARDAICGLPVDAGQQTTSHAWGAAWVTIARGGRVLWKFLLVRPAASSGSNGSGVELRYVDYRGKRVLHRAHVPILNVKYDADACGPFRDWQNEEGMIRAHGRDVAPGVRLCREPARTILDTGSDTGNYLGVAIFVEGEEVVLVSEMQAGWYRYVSQWRLHANGTIRPRFGFSAVKSSCVCHTHHHHAYWRFDFDIRTPGDNIVRERTETADGRGSWRRLARETRRDRDPARKRRWRVEHAPSGDAYDIIPGPHDGQARTSPDWPFGRGDVWLLRYHAGEIDDGSVAVGPPYEAGIDRWLDGERLDGDLVVWYGAHFTHDVAHETGGEAGHIVGPDLRPARW